MHLLASLFSSENLAALMPKLSLLSVIAAAKLGVVMPLIVAILSQPRFSKRTREVLSIASCLVAGAIVCLASGVFTTANVLVSVIILLTLSGSLYDRFYKPLGLAPWVEKVTTVGFYLIAVSGKNALTAFQAASATAATQQSGPLALPLPADADAVVGATDTLTDAAVRAVAQAEEAGDKASQVAQIAGNVAAEIRTIGK